MNIQFSLFPALTPRLMPYPTQKIKGHEWRYGPIGAHRDLSKAAHLLGHLKGLSAMLEWQDAVGLQLDLGRVGQGAVGNVDGLVVRHGGQADHHDDGFLGEVLDYLPDGRGWMLVAPLQQMRIEGRSVHNPCVVHGRLNEGLWVKHGIHETGRLDSQVLRLTGSRHFGHPDRHAGQLSPAPPLHQALAQGVNLRVSHRRGVVIHRHVHAANRPQPSE
mmetsp:Transcript_38585/g.110376  ORF Transcript_38585/g.110376 Transcript_38585/m.110376 type:complete len:217 (-) Transcript_38585:1288-1938(-)